MIPGSNLLNMALTLIAKQTITYYQYVSRSANEIGQLVSTYASPISILGSFQPVPRQLYMTYGLDLQKDYFTFYSSNNLLDINREVSGDQISYAGRRYQVESSNDWFAVDGWVGVICVDIGADS